METISPPLDSDVAVTDLVNRMPQKQQCVTSKTQSQAICSFGVHRPGERPPRTQPEVYKNHKPHEEANGGEPNTSMEPLLIATPTAGHVGEPSQPILLMLWNCEKMNCCFKPLHFGEACYGAVHDWSNPLKH